MAYILFLMDLMIVKPFSLKFCCIVSIFLGISAIFLHKKCVVLRKSAKLKYTCLKALFFKKFTCRGKRASTYVKPCMKFRRYFIFSYTWFVRENYCFEILSKNYYINQIRLTDFICKREIHLEILSQKSCRTLIK